MATQELMDAGTEPRNNAAESKDAFGPRSDLAFIVRGDPRIHTTHRQIARVPLSDYVLQPGTNHSCSQQTVVGITAQAIAGYEYEYGCKLDDLCARLKGWQEQQTVRQNIDSRSRFGCIVTFIQELVSVTGSRQGITGVAATYLRTHVRLQLALLKLEGIDLQDMMQVRREEGMPVTAAQRDRVQRVGLEMLEADEAEIWVRELVQLAVNAGLVVGGVCGAENDEWQVEDGLVPYLGFQPWTS